MFEPTEEQIFPNLDLIPDADQGAEPPAETPEVLSVYMTYYTLYDQAMGRVNSCGNCRSDELDAYRTLGPLIEGKFPTMEYYIDTSGPEPLPLTRPEFDIQAGDYTVVADGVTELTITGLPPYTLVGITGPVGMQGVSTDGTATLVFSKPGEYKIDFESFPYKETSRKIYAT